MGFQQRTNFCGTLRKSDVGNDVILNGWVQKRRDFGGVIFVDLRDRSGLVQVVFNPEINEKAHAIGDKVRSEYVLAVKGQVVERDAETVNPNMATGEIEIRVDEIEIINGAKTPPFFIEDGVDVDEQVRLKYRYLDLRRPEMYRIMELRHRVTKSFRDYLDNNGFLEVETPMLTGSTPEGARDYLVPSRVYPGEFFALPQSPQLFKQLLMVSGFERYFQIVRCFRDEDLRADRQPEFTQVDIETSFLPMERFLPIMEEMVTKVCQAAIELDVQTPFRRYVLSRCYGQIRFG